MVDFLLDRGADVKRVNGDIDALVIAVKHPDEDTLETLLHRGRFGGDVNQIINSESLLHQAFDRRDFNKSKRIIDILLSSPELKRETIDLQERFGGWTVLLRAAYYSKPSGAQSSIAGRTSTKREDDLTAIATSLLSYGADPNISPRFMGSKPRTALYYAALNGNLEMVKKLIEMGANASQAGFGGAKAFQKSLNAVEWYCVSSCPRYREIIRILQRVGGFDEVQGSL
jgi:ankyrin repeat protein